MKFSRMYLREFFNLSTIFLIICLVLVSILFFCTFQMKAVSTYLLPRILALFCAIGIIIALAIDFLKIGSPPREKEKKKEALEGINIFYSVIFASAYFILIPLLGFTLATCAALVVFSYLSGFKNKKIILLLAVALPLIFHFLFVSILQVDLPEGLLQSVIFF